MTNAKEAAIIFLLSRGEVTDFYSTTLDHLRKIVVQGVDFEQSQAPYFGSFRVSEGPHQSNADYGPALGAVIVTKAGQSTEFIVESIDMALDLATLVEKVDIARERGFQMVIDRVQRGY